MFFRHSIRMILKTDRLVLRPMAMADAADLFAIFSDPEAMAWWDRPPILRLAVAEDMIGDQIEAMADGLCLYWTVFVDDTAIGSCDLSLIDRAAGTAEAGFLFRQDRWDQGFATEAMTAVTGYGFASLKLSRLFARIHAGNGRARRLLLRLGFEQESTLPAYALPSGARVDCERYVLRAR